MAPSTSTRKAGFEEERDDDGRRSERRVTAGHGDQSSRRRRHDDEEASLDVITEKTVGVVASRPPSAAPATQTWQPTPAPTPPSRADAAADDGFALQGPLLRQRRGVILYGRLCWMVLHDAAAMWRRVSRRSRDDCCGAAPCSSTDQGALAGARSPRPAKMSNAATDPRHRYRSAPWIGQSGPYTATRRQLMHGNLERLLEGGNKLGRARRLIAIVVCVVGCCCCESAAVAVAKGACGLKKRARGRVRGKAISAAKPQDLHGQMARWYQAPQQAALHYRFGPFPQPERLENGRDSCR